MYTFDELQHVDKIEAEIKARIESRLAELEARKRELDMAADNALSENNAEGFTKADNERRMVSAQIIAARAELAETVSIEPANVTLVWSEYAEEYNAQFDKAMAEYAKARHKAAQLFLAMVKAQSVALEKYAYFSKLIGNHGELEELHMMDNNPNVTVYHRNNKIQPDAVCYINSGDISRHAYAGIVQVVNSRIPASIREEMPTGMENLVISLAGLTI